MGTRLANSRGKDLYAFWGDKVARAVNKAAGRQVVLNLASNEYFKSVDTSRVKNRIVTPVFKDFKGGKYKIVSFYAKKARGMMVAYVVKNGITDVERIKGFDTAGYYFDESQSGPDEWVFLRDEVAA